MKELEWGWLIILYLFFGGLSAGALILSGLATYVGGQERYTRLAKAGAFIAPFPVLIGTLLLIFDLGRPHCFWKLFVAFEPESPMWIGTWLLGLFLLVSLPYFNLFLPEKRRLWKPTNTIFWKSLLAAAGFPLGVCVGIYTGVLLGAVPARPFWNTPMVALLFLFSALSTSTALLFIVMKKFVPGLESKEERRLLLSADVIFILLELLIIAPYIIHGKLSPLSARESLALILGGSYTGLFWIGVILLGLIFPLVIEVIELAPRRSHHKKFRIPGAMETLACVFVLAGGFLLRFVFVFAGQLSSFQ
ncbi:MAG TPA: NrfD/PsrC family molybdoenzyme membrane anchor subunit [Acidobacteriota bacterium]|nr:NrfD/PsrC family molybdoenzyme membrane anchor subunit [Acidobacteriota bacterium]